ncbi:galactokinase [Compostibacter hankyongensis]|uniref:Galactokinase n=1 Tax=Compostibacter hankyongensis TaxID=1007089 RepID=A0ABP8FJA2_9BACT
MCIADKVNERFMALYHTTPLLILSPGRVNIIGEHTDYNDGFVLPAAIDKKIALAIAPSGSGRCTVHAAALEDSFSFDCREEVRPAEGWKNYILGVVHHLQQRGYRIDGFNAVFDGDIPIGSGLSSSAAVEGAFSFGLTQVFGLDAERFELALIGQQAEHTFVGVNCGIMDQFANLHGRKNQLIRLDCRDLSYVYVPFNFPGYKIVLCNTMVHHSLASSAYNERRRQCEEGVKVLRDHYPEVKSLRDVTPAMLEEHKTALDSTVYRRCRYIVEETERVVAACACLEKDDLLGLGRLMDATHDGLSGDYEVSCPELDYLVSLARPRSEVIGSRMMGGGFGGCTINIVEADAVKDFSDHITDAYTRQYGKRPDIYVTTIEEGTHAVSYPPAP